MDKLKDIAEYVQGIDLHKKSPLEFLIEDSVRTNPSHKYIVRKIISQLSVRDHIHNMGPSLGTDNTRAILRTNSKWF